MSEEFSGTLTELKSGVEEWRRMAESHSKRWLERDARDEEMYQLRKRALELDIAGDSDVRRFAAASAAMQGILAYYGTPDEYSDESHNVVWEIHARDAVRAADALIAALNRTIPTEAEK